ncbi:MAG TPA: heavy-metal-associated domain-containing protein [Rhodocyclaceae bacterium]
MYQFHVPNMSCGHCVARITKALQAADSGAAVKVDLTTKTVSVESPASEATLREVLNEAGYPAA